MSETARLGAPRNIVPPTLTILDLDRIKHAKTTSCKKACLQIADNELKSNVVLTPFNV
jgi:hypothetical protein